MATPLRTTRRMPSSSATSHRTGTGVRGMPPIPSSASGWVASLVHNTTPSGRGSPEETPSVKGLADKAGTGSVAPLGTWPSAMTPATPVA